MSEYLVTKQDVIKYMKNLEEGSKAFINYFIKDSNEDKIYMIYDVSTDEHGVRFTGVDVEDLTIEHRTLLYDYEKIKVTKAEPDYAGRMIITIDEELRVASGEFPFIFDTYAGLNRRIEVVLDDESYYVTSIQEFSKPAPYIIAMELLRQKDGLVKQFTSRRNMLWSRDSQNYHKFTATKDVL
jgi:hypothetical protein